MINTEKVNIDGKNYTSLQLQGEEKKCYEIIQVDDVYEMIHNGTPLSLDNVCVYGFSMDAYRKKYSLLKDSVVTVQFDSIVNCLFCGRDGIAADFSSCSFVAMDEDLGINFDNNIFYCGIVKFSYSHIGDWDFSMKGCRFFKCNCNFSYTVFENKDVFFNKTIFEDECDVNFTGTDFGEEGLVTFSYMKGFKGSVDFYRCKFGENKLDFTYMDCPGFQYIFWENETPTMSIDFVDSVVWMILLYKANINGLLDFRILNAEHIVIQESVIRDCVLLGNRGYKNNTSYCLKKSTLLGRIKIQNKFSKKLFQKQLQYAYDEKQDKIVLCPTSATDKANQLTILSENYQNEGETDNADAAYVLSKRYRSIGRIHDIWDDYGAIKRTEEYTKSVVKLLWGFITISVRLIGSVITWLFEKVFLDILCGNYATKPSKFLFWILVIITGFAWGYNWLGIDMANIQTINGWNMAWLNSLQIFLQIENESLFTIASRSYYFMIVEKIIGLVMFSVFVVSYTRKVIK